MSDSDESANFSFDDDSGSDFDASPQPKKKAPAKPKALTAGPSKLAAKPKPTAIKKKPLKDRDNLPSQDASDGDMDFDPSPKPKVKAAAAGSKKTASETYQKLSQIEHVLKRPDTYIGSVEPIKQGMWVFDKEKKAMVNRDITFVPGLYKIVDEILVNAADNKQRDPNMDVLKVVVDPEKNLISVMNNGAGIPIEMHSREKCYIPELIFGHLLAGSNFDDEEKKTTGGRNGYGAKLANIYSTEFIVETASKASGQQYKQTWKNNMGIKGAPKITDAKKSEDFTKISFKPDLEKFNLAENGLAGDMEALLSKRVYDMAGTLRDVKVFLNGERIKINGFKKYVDMYTSGINELSKTGPTDPETAVGSPSGKQTILYERCGERWEVAFYPSDGQFQQCSFVNSIATTKGGTHVDHVVKQFVDKIVEASKKKNAKLALKPFQVKNHLWVFVNCLIENPAFDSQTKENMTLGASKFGSKCAISDEFMKKVLKTGVLENVQLFAKSKEEAALKKTDGSKRSRITGIVKLEDANNAGTKNARNCTLILTEGDSAKALVVGGLGVVGRDNYGVFPLRGKLLNVREASGAQLLANTEIQHIKQIMGLQQGKTYTSVDSLRYGSLMIMTDQDHDGSHIKGLIINFLDHFFPSLLKIPGFLVEFITPIVKATKKNNKSQEISFFTMPEYEQWKEENHGGRDWHVKYYKGLGTSTTADAKKYFGAMNRHRLKFGVTAEGERELIDMAFNKKKADNRKEWLRNFEPGTFLDQNVSHISYSDFINKELILFSMADNLRSIPSVVDGFKPGQRKVLFACCKRKLKNEIKVAQLSGYVSEHAAYHHGEVSLAQTIVGLAQSFVGSNNVGVLSPMGQFGTRAQGGKDAASPRYIFTSLERITRVIFHPADDHVLSYLHDDGASIEPEWYAPVLPMVLVNGSSGIGTGWSSDVPNYNPIDIVENLRRKLRGEDLEPMHPWFRGFRGTIEPDGPNKYKVTGKWNEISDGEFEVTELPVRVWTQDYKESLESWIAGGEKMPTLVKDYREHHTEASVHFVINLTEKGKEAVQRDGIEKTFKLSRPLGTTNMVCFDVAGKIKKYSTPEQILDDFYDLRLTYYQKRKEWLVQDLTLTYERLSNQARFVLMIVERKLVISNRKKADIVAELRKLDFRPFPKVAKVKAAGDPDAAGADDEGAIEEDTGSGADFDYLLSMAISRLTAEQVAKLLAERDGKEHELNVLLGKTAKQLWETDLDAFLEEWRAVLDGDDKVLRASAKRTKMMKGKAAKAKKLADDVELDSDGEEVYVPKAAKKAAVPKPKPTAAPTPGSSSVVDFEPIDKKPKPAAKPKGKKRASSDVEDEPKPKPVKKKKTLPSDDEDDEDVFTVKKKASKPVAAGGKAKAKLPLSDGPDDDSMEIDMPPPARASPKPQRARKAPVKSAYVELSDSDEGSDFVDDD